MGYLWKNNDSQKRAPHEVIPLDFTPIHLPYPPNNTQQITRTAAAAASGTSSTHIQNYVHSGSNSSDYAFNNNKAKKVDNEEEDEDPVRIIKRRLAKGEISKEEYEELRNAIAS